MQKYLEVAGYSARQHPTMMIVLALSLIALALMCWAADREVEKFTRDNPGDGQ